MPGRVGRRVARAPLRRERGGAVSASSIDGDGRSVASLTLTALKTYENRGPTFWCISYHFDR